MPIARIGYGTDFILKDQGVGIGTDTAGVLSLIHISEPTRPY